MANSDGESEHPIFKKLCSFRTRIFESTSTISRGSSDIINDDHIHRYTSLKDLLLNSPSNHASLCEANTFDSSNILIRNELVKHAASVYVQSAAIIVNKDRDWIATFGEKIKSYFRVSFLSCFLPIIEYLDYIVSRLRRSLS